MEHGSDVNHALKTREKVAGGLRCARSASTNANVAPFVPVAQTVKMPVRATSEAKDKRGVCLFLPEGLVKGRDDRPDQVIERSALLGRNHDRYRHTRIELNLVARC